MDNKCPGKQSKRQLDSVVVPCPNCGRLVEFFSDEPKRRCRCGRDLLREALPQCAEWCVAAAQCLGQAIDLRELQERVEQVKNDPRAQKCLEAIQEQLKNKRKQQLVKEAPLRPARQEPDRIAQQKAVRSLRGQTAAQLRWLGAELVGSVWRLPVLDGSVEVQLDTGDVVREDGGHVRSGLRVLVLHYLDVRSKPAAQRPEVTFASLASARTYASVYESRVNERICATVGQNIDTLRRAATAIRAREVAGGDVAVEVKVLPRVPVRLIWHAGDEELPPACTLLLPPQVDSFLSIEDIVVLSESFVSRLSGKPL